MNESLFENIRHVNEYGQEYWTARELQPVLEYTEWRNFKDVIAKAQNACKVSGHAVSDHFVDVTKIVKAGATSKPVEDFNLSRYACYLVAMNGDARKKAVALAQTYFAVKTRQQELIDNFNALDENQKRLAIRQEMKRMNKALADTAHAAGVTTRLDYATFQNAGYLGLYTLNQEQIHKRKGLAKGQKILDHMGSTELAANLFRITQTDEKLKRDNVQGKEKANDTHFTVGRNVRQAIAANGGTMPENLPTPTKSIQEIEREKNLTELNFGGSDTDSGQD